MKRLLRPSMLLLVLAVAAAGAALWVFESTAMPARPVPLPVGAGDREIAWLYSATGSVNWQRFVQAVEKVPGADTGRAFPELTTAVPEVALALPRGRLLFRWYKVTSEWKTDYWLKALVGRTPPPLAIIGGNTTDAATDQAVQLRTAAADLAEKDRPLLLLTTATADRVRLKDSGAGSEGVRLVDLYRGRTFRFCFSNSQMAAAVSHFVWSRPELRPDAFPSYLAVWQDDPYSSDLIDGFLRALQPYHFRARVKATAGDWLAVSGFAGLRGFPVVGLATELARNQLLPRTSHIPWSVGSFDRPNRPEAEAARDVLDALGRQQRQKRPLLVLAGQSQPSRRFVRALARLEPGRVRNFVMATGDAIPFNTVSRDRNVTWPIQDLPCTLVFFCHYNPIFGTPTPSGSGTEDLLLYETLVTALKEANASGDRACANADELRERLRRLRLVGDRPSLGTDGLSLFDDDGNRRGGTGEHVVWLQPQFEGERVLPEATLTVYSWQPGGQPWRLLCRPPLRLLYTGAQ